MTNKQGEACPNCGVGKLVVRSGRYSDFLGCDMFRHTGCNFIGKIDKEDLKDGLEKQADTFLAMHGRQDLIMH